MSDELRFQFFEISKFTLPDHEDPPSCSLQFASVFPVTSGVLLKLGSPELDAGLWRIRIFAPGMPMPEATVNEHYRPVFGQHDIRLAALDVLVKSESQTHAMKHRPNRLFRPGVPAPDARHHLATGFLVDNIRHGYFGFVFLFLPCFRYRAFLDFNMHPPDCSSHFWRISGRICRPMADTTAGTTEFPNCL